ncbi:MAG TPA: MmgE/PrpD family protein [Bacillota bacterium]
MNTDAIEMLVKQVAGTDLRDLSAKTVQRTKLMILDILGIIVAGAMAPSVKPLLDQAREWGGKPEASVLVFGDRLPAPTAGQLNAVMARSFDYDDCDEETGYHPGFAAVPAALAAAETVDFVSGGELITAVAAATDAVLRIRSATRLRAGNRMPWTSGTFAPLIAAFAAGRILKLPVEMFRNALGIAYTELSGTSQGLLDGAMAHCIQQGTGVQAGLAAVALARRGITGIQNVLEGRFGLYNAYHFGEYERERILADLGRKNRIDDVSIKIFPCCKLSHGAVQAIMELLAEGVDPRTVTDITVRVNGPAYILCGDQPWSPPKTQQKAQFSIPYIVGAALARRRVTLEEFTLDALHSKDILDYASRVRVLRDDKIDALGLQVAPTEVEVTINGSQIKRYRIEYVPGHPCKPLSFDQVTAKFEACVRYGAPQASETAIKSVVEGIKNLEEVSDIQQLIRPLAPIAVA